MITPLADTQYHDYVGTAEADKSDYSDLFSFAKAKGINTQRFEPIGISFYHNSDVETTSVAVICKDRVTGKAYSVSIPDVTVEEYFREFKRFNVMLFRNAAQPDDDLEIEEIDRDELDNID